MKAYDENEAVQTIISLGISHSEAAIRNALRQYNGDLDRAASALMTESEDVNDMPALEPLVSDSSKSQTSKSVAPPPSIVVDLTGEDEEDEELKKALSLSMSDSIEHKHKEWGVPSSQAQTAKFGPSTREDTDGSWAVVPSSLNDNKRPSPDDADLQRAMAASLQTSFGECADVTERTRITKESCHDIKLDIPLSDNPLVPPVALIRGSARYSTHNALPLLIQALYVIPQVRRSLRQSGKWDPSSLNIMPDGLHEGPMGLLNDGKLWGDSALQSFYNFREIQQLFCALDYTQQAHLDITHFLHIFGAEESSHPKPPGTQSLELFTPMSQVIDNALELWCAAQNIPYDRLFTLNLESRSTSPLTSSSHSYLSLTVRQPDLNSVYACLDQYFFGLSSGDGQVSGSKSSGRGFISPKWSPPPVLVMRLHHDPREHKDVNRAHGSAPTVKTPFTTTEMTLSAASEKLKNVNSSTAPKIPFSFPTLLQLDRYLEENSAKTMASVNQMKELKMAGEDLREQLRTLETRNGKETLPPLRNTLRYIQEVASADTPERKEAHQVAARKLSTLIAKIERHINSTKSKIGVNSAEYEALAISFASEPARHPYKLRAVLMHDGLYGPKNMYAYLFTNGNWYKSVWDEVTMVTEDTVIGDKAGLYLNSGPYMLIYSRDDPVPAPFPDSEGPVAPYWSDHHLRTVKDDNAALRSRLYGRNQNVWWDVPRMPEEEFWASGDLEGIDSLSSWTPELTTESANAEEKPAIFNTKHLSSWDQAPDIAVSQRGDVSSAMVTRDNTPAPSPQVSDTEMDDMTNQINDHPN